MKANERDEATAVVNAVVADLVNTCKVDPGRAGSIFRVACGDILADAASLINAAQIATPLAGVFDLARQAGATFKQIDSVRADTAAIATTYFSATSVKNTCIRLALVQCARILAATDLTSRPQVDAYIDGMNDAFDGAEETAAASLDQAAYRSIIALHAAVTFDLTTRERTLPTIVVYNFPLPRPALWIANRLYGDAAREDDLIAENMPVHPAFMQSPVRALSA